MAAVPHLGRPLPVDVQSTKRAIIFLEAHTLALIDPTETKMRGPGTSFFSLAGAHSTGSVCFVIGANFAC
jgi:hypothetical protein